MTDPAQTAYECFRDEYQLEYPEGLPTWLALPAKDRMAWIRIANSLAGEYPSEDDIQKRIDSAVEDEREDYKRRGKEEFRIIREALQELEAL